MDDILLEPLKGYTDIYERAFEENAEKYFDDLTKRAGVNVDENRATVKEYYGQLDEIKRHNAKLNGIKTGKGLLIALIVIGALAAIIGVVSLINGGDALWAIAIALGAVAIVVPAVVIPLVINPKIKQGEQEVAEHERQASKLKEIAYSQMASLNALFESDATKKLIEKTVPKLVIDDNFDIRRYDYLAKKYGFGDNDDTSSSTIALLSGEILGNPFVVDRELVHTMGSKTYTGSIVISWTTSYTDSQGHSQTVHHSETLYASVQKPYPTYSEQTRLIYGNEAAPRLTFTHSPSHAERYSPAELERYVKKQGKVLQKLSRKALTDNDDSTNFTEMGNAEFDALFGAVDRDNEVEFRLLFTPLAQKNMLELMKSNRSYGDDFYFYKSRCLNYISSEHSAQWDLDTDYHRYQSFDYDASHRGFLDFNKRFFKSLYFELAPLLAIPLYQQHKPVEYIYNTTYGRNYTSYETECAVNKLGYQHFQHELAATPSILKAGSVRKDGATDKTQITAYAYTTENRVEFVSVFGGDGFFHEVPVHWVEYIPVSRESTVNIKQFEMSDKEFNAKRKQAGVDSVLSSHSRLYNYYRKLLCCLSEDESGATSFDKDVGKALN